MRKTVAGRMLDFRFRVIDPEKATIAVPGRPPAIVARIIASPAFSWKARLERVGATCPFSPGSWQPAHWRANIAAPRRASPAGRFAAAWARRSGSAVPPARKSRSRSRSGLVSPPSKPAMSVPGRPARMFARRNRRSTDARNAGFRIAGTNLPRCLSKIPRVPSPWHTRQSRSYSVRPSRSPWSCPTERSRWRSRATARSGSSRSAWSESMKTVSARASSSVG
ncbi:MAG: hypothetical protein HW377_1339 [Actinobacteria bacterium]|nr:hypothetical protein [Actinomycetota bacterium]